MSKSDSIKPEHAAPIKDYFTNIDIPSDLDKVISHAIERGEQDMDMNMYNNKNKAPRTIFKMAASFIIIMSLFVLSLNTVPAVADSISKIPGLGTLVKVLQFDKGQGSGGQITDGTQVQIGDLDQEAGQERLTINFFLDDAPTMIANYFEVTYSEYPFNLLFSIPGARGYSVGDIFTGLAESKLIEDLYRIVTLDDSMERFVITFKKPVDFEVREFSDPARIELILSEKKQAPSLLPIYSLRTSSYPFGETVGVIENILRFEADGKAVRLLKDSEGTFIVEEGLYQSEQEALARMHELTTAGLLDTSFFIEKREVDQIPRAIK